MRLLKTLSGILILVLSFSSCKLLRPSFMLQTKPNYNFSKISDTLLNENYRIAPNDGVSFRVFSNDGFKLVDIANNAGGAGIARAGIEEIVDQDGLIKLPLLGKIKISGYTLREAQVFLEKEYEAYYVKPFIQLSITNKRVIIFPGAAGAARVLQLQYNNTTVFEAIALAGGISQDGKAYRIKLIRRVTPNSSPIVYLIDLSKIEGIAAGNMVVLANDIIYVETRPRIAQRTLQEISPYLSLLTTSITLYYLFSK
jgi:polysaccharide export outer membrane protein